MFPPTAQVEEAIVVFLLSDHKGSVLLRACGSGVGQETLALAHLVVFQSSVSLTMTKTTKVQVCPK